MDSGTPSFGCALFIKRGRSKAIVCLINLLLRQIVIPLQLSIKPPFVT